MSLRDLENPEARVRLPVISLELPEKFGIIMDDWTDSVTSTHFLALFACDPDPNDTTSRGKIVLLEFSPLLDEADMSATSQEQFITETLRVFNRNKNPVLSFVVDNATVNTKIARNFEKPPYGCASHRFNLASNANIKDQEQIVNRVNKLMKIAGT